MNELHLVELVEDVEDVEVVEVVEDPDVEEVRLPVEYLAARLGMTFGE